MTRRIRTDVLVVGAGASGIPAAVAAAREGARVVLLEDDPVVGGSLVDMYVAMLCGGPVTGFWDEMRERMKQNFSFLPGVRWFLPSHWLLGLNRIIAEEKSITVILGAKCEKAIVDDSGKVKGAIVDPCGCKPVIEAPLDAISADGELTQHASYGPVEIEAAVTIDATGTGLFSEVAGCQIMYGRDARSTFGESLAPEKADLQVQMVTQMYVSQRLPGAKGFDMTRLENVKLGVLVSELGWFHQYPEKALEMDLGIHLHWGCAVRCRDTRDPIAVSQAQRDALDTVAGDLDLLRKNGYAVYLAPKIGVREVRRVLGEYVIAQGHLLEGLFPEDTVAVCGYGLDIWGENLSKEARSKRYGIPLRALIPKGVRGLLVTGKCASGSHIAMSSYRVVPVVGSMGQAAGVTAALCAQKRTEPSTLDVAEVREKLSKPPHNVTLN